MSKYDRLEGWFTFAAIVVLIVMLLILPIPLLLAWKGIAVAMFGLPMLGYWPAFWANLTMAIWFGGIAYRPRSKE